MARSFRQFQQNRAAPKMQLSESRLGLCFLRRPCLVVSRLKLVAEQSSLLCSYRGCLQRGASVPASPALMLSSWLRLLPSAKKTEAHCFVLAVSRAQSWKGWRRSAMRLSSATAKG